MRTDTQDERSEQNRPVVRLNTVLLAIGGLLLLSSSSCSSIQDSTSKQDGELLRTAISQQLQPKRVIIKSNKVWLDRKELGPLDASQHGQYGDLPKNLPGGITSYEITDLGNGWLFLSGGYLPERENELPRASKETFFWNLSTKKLENGPEMSCPRVNHNVTQLLNGKWLITGGASLMPESTYATAVDILDTKSKSIRSGGSLKVDRINHAVISLDSERVLIVGGQTWSSKTTNGMETRSVELYNCKDAKSFEIGELCRARQSASLFKLNGTDVLVVDGYNSDSERPAKPLPPEVIKLTNRSL